MRFLPAMLLCCLCLCPCGCQKFARWAAGVDEPGADESSPRTHDRSMPCSAQVMAAMLDRQLGGSLCPASAELVAVQSRGGLRYAWVLTVQGRPQERIVRTPMDITDRPGDGPASKALLRAREFLADHYDRIGREERSGEIPVATEHLAEEYQQRVYGLQVVRIALVLTPRTQWEIKAVPAQETAPGGVIHMTFPPDGPVHAQFGR